MSDIQVRESRLERVQQRNLDAINHKIDMATRRRDRINVTLKRLRKDRDVYIAHINATREHNRIPGVKQV